MLQTKSVFILNIKVQLFIFHCFTVIYSIHSWAFKALLCYWSQSFACKITSANLGSVWKFGRAGKFCWAYEPFRWAHTAFGWYIEHNYCIFNLTTILIYFYSLLLLLSDFDIASCRWTTDHKAHLHCPNYSRIRQLSV